MAKTKPTGMIAFNTQKGGGGLAAWVDAGVVVPHAIQATWVAPRPAAKARSVMTATSRRVGMAEEDEESFVVRNLRRSMQRAAGRMSGLCGRTSGRQTWDRGPWVPAE